MRIFIAINFQESTRSALVHLCNDLKATISSGRLALPENLHLTLAFLDECNATQVNTIKAAMDLITFEPFKLEINCIGRYRRSGGDIVWAGICENKALFELHKNITSQLRENGISFDMRKFSPHITLGREIITNSQPRRIVPIIETITKFELMESERIKGKLTYTAIHERSSVQCS